MQPDTITIQTKAERIIDADSADLVLCVTGASVFSGAEAIRKAAEVKAMTSALINAGIDESRIKLRSVEINGQAIAILKSSATYRIKVARIELELLPTILGIVADQKNASIDHLEWKYSAAEKTARELRATALNEAVDIGKQDADLLGVRLVGIHNLSEQQTHDGNVLRESIGVHSSGFRSKTAKSVDLGFALGNSTKVVVRLIAEFRVSEFE